MLEIAVSPDGKFYLEAFGEDDLRIEGKLKADPGGAILYLANAYGPKLKSASVSFWSEFGKSFLRNFCASCDGVVHRDGEVIKLFASCVPNIRGSEYIDTKFLEDVWDECSSHIQGELEKFKGSSSQYIGKYYPEWSGVGLVHFHLAENKNSELNPFVFLATYTTRVSDKARVQHTPLGEVLKESALHSKKDILLSVLKPLKAAAEESKFIGELLKTKRVYTPQYFSSSEAYDFLRAVPCLEKAGITIKLPKWWHGNLPSRAKVSVKIGDDEKQSFVGFNALFKFHVNVRIDGKVLDERDLKKILNKNQPLVKIHGKWVEVDKDKITGILEKWQKAESLQREGFTFAESMRLLSRSAITKEDCKTDDASSASWLEFTSSKNLRELLQKMQSPSSIISRDIDLVIEQDLKAKLRPYQYEGVKWLSMLSTLGLGACLADDMGLGKTIQIISLLLIEKKRVQKDPSFLVVPTSLLGNWENELVKFAPSLRYKILHSSQSSKTNILEFSKHYASFDLVITTYSLVLRVSWLLEKEWNIVILDEAQAIKNPNAKQTKAIKNLKSRVNIALTGTPIENSLSDLWSIYDFSCPALLGKFTEFKNFHKSLKSLESYTPLRKLISPYLLRRKKTDKSIIKDLPEKTELKSFCLLTKEQIKLYRETIDEMARDLNDDNTDIKRKGLILSYLLKFKQICNHPSQLQGDNEYDFKKSGKFFRLREISETIAARGEKMLVFTQFRELTDVLTVFLAEIFGKKGYVLHGGTPVKKRKEMVEEFQNSEEAPYFILSLKAGGTGLNLTRASHVIHFDRWWNPAVENQATDRVFRIGQKRNVVVHKFVCKGTIEEKIDLMIEDKKSIAENVIEGNKEIKFTEFSNEELMDLISLDVNTAQMSE